jgi:methyl-accepting chemotaxis protein
MEAWIGMHGNIIDDVTRAIGAHGLWKGRLISALRADDPTLDPVQLARDDVCDFGRFLYGPAIPAAEKAGPHYQRVKALHAAFHRCVCDVVVRARAGRKAEAEEALRPGGPFATASADLTQAMMAWQQALRRAA